MILTFRGCPDPPGSRWYYELPHMEIGGEYEVAEIFEMEGHVMARRPGADRWPVPGMPAFGIHPEWFAPTDEPIPIVSCGFYYNDYLEHFYGVLMWEPRRIEAVEHLSEVDLPDDEEGFEQWRSRAVGRASIEVAQALYELLDSPVPTEFPIFRDVFLAHDIAGHRIACEKLGAAGAFLHDLARQDVSRHDYSETLGRLLNALEIPSFEVEEIDLGFWQGTGGGRRLINAPPGGRLIYGTENPPDFMLPEGAQLPGSAAGDDSRE